MGITNVRSGLTSSTLLKSNNHIYLQYIPKVCRLYSRKIKKSYYILPMGTQDAGNSPISSFLLD